MAAGLDIGRDADAAHLAGALRRVLRWRSKRGASRRPSRMSSVFEIIAVS